MSEVLQERHGLWPSRLRDRLRIGVFCAAGMIALGLALVLLTPPAKPMGGSGGPLGEVKVYAQTVHGLQPLTAGRRDALPRPQDLVFRLDSAGRGQRRVRIELETEGDRGPRRFLHEAILSAPARQLALDYVARFGERDPEELTLVVAVDAPHLDAVERRYPFRLVTESPRSLDPEALRRRSH